MLPSRNLLFYNALRNYELRITNYAFFLRQYSNPAAPRINSAQVDGSGTALVSIDAVS